MSETSSIYLMHKYWGKKPSEELSRVVSDFSKEGDTVLDPFAGFGGIAIECLLQNRNVIINDLNPSATFIAKNILDTQFDLDKFNCLFQNIKRKYQAVEKQWYFWGDNKIVTILRNNDDTPQKIKVCKGKSFEEISLSQENINAFLQEENDFQINTWFPENQLLVNSRISAKKGMRINDLFSKRALICQSYLYKLIDEIEPSSEKDLLLFSFTSNLANCSKLVPPITSRGDMAQGAWMTGFYIGETYLENNVFHYFENRIKKTIKGKECYLSLREKNKVHSSFSILNEDAKKLSVKDASVDLVFTDFPYGDTVPYFEQSQLWNSWLKKVVDYENEIVVSNSNEREKTIEAFVSDIDKAIKEIARVLKNDKYFVFTFHSLSGIEWAAIVKALNKHGFCFDNCNVILQKTLPPRQLNRNNTIKGDIIAVYKKSENQVKNDDFYSVFNQNINDAILEKREFETNDLILICIKTMLSTGFADNVNFNDLLEKRFFVDEETKKWRIKNELF